MIRPRRFEPFLIIFVALAVPVAVSYHLLAQDSDSEPVSSPDDRLHHPGIISSPTEDRQVDLESWLDLAGESPRTFAATLRWCEAHAHMPLPNCRNAFAAAHASIILAAESKGVSHAP